MIQQAHTLTTLHVCLRLVFSVCVQRGLGYWFAAPPPPSLVAPRKEKKHLFVLPHIHTSGSALPESCKKKKLVFFAVRRYCFFLFFCVCMTRRIVVSREVKAPVSHISVFVSCCGMWVWVWVVQKWLSTFGSFLSRPSLSPVWVVVRGEDDVPDVCSF